MIRLVTRGKFTGSHIKGLVDAPEDREPAVRKLVEAAGGKLISFYFTTGDHDFMLIVEAPDAESIVAGTMAAAAPGTITGMTTIRAWTAAEFKPVAEKAAKVASAYRAPGRARRPTDAVWSG
jgi:uncharacterized protein with GYD domain